MTALGRDRTEKAGHAAEQLGAGAIPAGPPAGSRTAVPPRGGHRQRRRRRRQRVADAADESGASRAGAGPRRGSDSTSPQRADAEAGRVGDEVVHVQSTLLLATAYREQGDLARAGDLLAEFERAQRERGLPPGHVAYAALASEQALLAEARGDLGLAAAAADRAVAIAEASEQGRDVLARSLVRRANLGVVRGQATAATADARRALALELEKAEPGSVTSVLGRAYLALGAALAAAGETREANARPDRGAAASRAVGRRGPSGHRYGPGRCSRRCRPLDQNRRRWLAGTREAHYNQWFQPTGRSFNGRTADSDSAYRGSNPCLPAIRLAVGSLMAARRASVTSRLTSASRLALRVRRVANGSESLPPSQPLFLEHTSPHS